MSDDDKKVVEASIDAGAAGMVADVDMGGSGKVTPVPVDKSIDLAVQPAAITDDDKEKEGEKPEEGTAEGVPEDLGNFKPSDPESLEKFDERYFTPEGKLSQKALSEEFYSNAVPPSEGVEGSPGKLNEGTYVYLEHRLGVSRQMVNELEAGLVAKQVQGDTGHREAVEKIAGTPERYTAALAWGAEGYTPAQQARFDDVVRNRKEGWEDAVTALMARYDASNPMRTMRPPGRPSTAQRDATNPQGGAQGNTPRPVAAVSGVEPFASHADYLQALREAEGDNKKIGVARDRLRVSPFMMSQQL